MAEPCLLGTEGGAEPERSWMKCEKQNQNQPKKIHGRQKEAKTVGTNICGSKTLVARKKTKVWKHLETIVFFSGNKRFAETFETARKNKHSTPMVERFILPEETKVCLKGLFPVTKQTSHNILSNKGFQHMLLEQHSE